MNVEGLITTAQVISWRITDFGIASSLIDPETKLV